MPRRVDHDAQRELVCDAVARIAISDGFGAVTIRQVASMAGASTSVVTHYFASRDELLSQSVRREVERRKAQAESAVRGSTGRAGLRALAEWSVLDIDEDSQRLWLAIIAAARTEPVLRDEIDRFNQWWGTALRRMIGDLDRDRGDHVGVDPAPPGSNADGRPEHRRRRDSALLADVFDVIVDGLIVAGFEGRDLWSAERRRRTLDALLASQGL